MGAGLFPIAPDARRPGGAAANRAHVAREKPAQRWRDLPRHRLYYDGPLHDRPNVRPWSLHRTGYAGGQRYGGWIWSGDTDSRWDVFADQVAMGLNHGLSLTPFWGSDTGGFFPTPELTGEL